jgi:hypothetical protein
MRSNRRLQRAEAQVDSEPLAKSESPAPAPAIRSLLMLQRHTGNRAVARLMYNPNNTRLVVPDSYGDKPIPWEEKKLRRGAPTTPLSELANADADFRRHLKGGMHVPALGQVTAVPDAELQTNAAKLAKPAQEGDTAEVTTAKQQTVTALSEAAVDHDRVLFHSHGTKYGAPSELQTQLVMSRPDQFVPEKDDLPSAETDLFERIPGKTKKEETYWTYACVLIALVKSDEKTAKRLAKSDSSELEVLVQRLHAYYVRKNIPYDDTSSRFTVMDEWGLTPIFFGETSWTDLPKFLELPAGDYIFDIVGHTVAVNVPKTIPKSEKSLSTVKDLFVPDSDERNYARGLETGKKVLSIWKK